MLCTPSTPGFLREWSCPLIQKETVRCFHEKQKAGFFGNGFDPRERAYL